MILIYTTCKDKEEARLLAKGLVSSSIVACANIIPGMESVYKWEGKVEASDEVVLLLKTKEENFLQVESFIKENHSYECPCIFSLNSDQISKEFESWVFAQI